MFQTLGQVFQQHQGTGICNQISPVVSNIAITLTERIWYSSFQTQLQDMLLWRPLLVIRYVDNRFALFPEQVAARRALQVFSHKHFFELPVELEDVGTKLLGFDVDANTRTIRYRHDIDNRINLGRFEMQPALAHGNLDYLGYAVEQFLVPDTAGHRRIVDHRFQSLLDNMLAKVSLCPSEKSRSSNARKTCTISEPKRELEFIPAACGLKLRGSFPTFLSRLHGMRTHGTPNGCF